MNTNNIKYLLSSEGWRELKKEMEELIAETDKEVLIEANKVSPSLDILRKLSCKSTALKEVLSLPLQLIGEAEEIGEERY